MDPKGKNALIVGGVTGIGFECVKELLRHGVKEVIVIDLKESLFKDIMNEIKPEFGEGKLTCLQADISVDGELEAQFRRALDQMKTIDILLNNAGIAGDHVWSKMVDINLKGVMRGTFLGLEHMKRGGVIINTASIVGLEPFYKFPSYSATKCGVLGFTRSYGSHMQFDRYGIRCMTMCPGMTATPILPGFISPEYFNRPENVRKESIDVSQEPLRVAEGILYMIKDGQNGAVFLTNDSKTYEVKLPTFVEYSMNRVL